MKNINFQEKIRLSNYTTIKVGGLAQYFSTPNNIDEYVENAIYFYKNRDELLDLKKKLLKNILSTPLFDTKQFSKNFEKILLNIFYKHTD